jgi:uncharacterized protein YbjT (DUF2867 family)
MSNTKIIAVVGATGAQGGGLCQAILNDPAGGFACRAITRDPGKEKAQALAARGADVVAADIDDVDSLKRAFAGAHGIFCVTNFWEHFSAEKELAQAKNLADAARSANPAHVIWSTLEDTRKFMSPDDARMPMLQGRYRVPHFDAKGEADAYFADLPTTYLVASLYWDNLYAFGLFPKKSDDGVYHWALPMGDKPLSGIASEDIGKAAYGIFKAGSKYIGTHVGVSGEHLTIEQMAAKITKAVGIEPIRYEAVGGDAYRAFGFPGADELGNMFQVYRDFEPAINRMRDPVLTRTLNPDTLTFDQFLAKYGGRIPR